MSRTPRVVLAWCLGGLAVIALEKAVERVWPWLATSNALIPALFALAAGAAIHLWYQRRDQQTEQASAFTLFKAAQELVPQDVSLFPVADGQAIPPGFRPYHATYIEREAIAFAAKPGFDADRTYSESDLAESLRGERRLLLIGRPTEGKTRTLYEVVRKMTDWTVVQPRLNVMPTDEAFALLEGRDVVCLIDDLNEYLGQPISLLEFCKAAANHSRRFALAAACRDGGEFSELQAAHDSPQRRFYESFDLRLSLRPARPEERARLQSAVRTGGDTVVTTLGSICMQGAYARMLERFEALQRRTRDCHNAIQLLVCGGVQPLSHERILRAWSTIWHRNDGPAVLRDELDVLRRHGFLFGTTLPDPVLPEMAYYESEEAQVFYSNEVDPKTRFPRDNLPKLFDAFLHCGDVEVSYQVAVKLALSTMPAQALPYLDSLHSLPWENESAERRNLLAKGSFARAWTLGSLDRSEEAIDTYEELLRRFVDDVDDGVLEQVSKALLNKGVRLGVLNRSEEEIAAYDDLLLRFGENNNSWARRQTARACVYKGITFGMLNRPDEAIGAYDEVLRRFGEDTESDVREQLAVALVNKGIRLGNSNHAELAISVYDDVLRRFGEDRENEVRIQVVKASLGRGYLFGTLDRPDEALSAYDDVLRRFDNATDGEQREVAAQALVNKGVQLGKLGRSEEEVRAYDEVIERFGEDTGRGVQEQLVRALVYKGITLNSLDRPEDEISTYDEMLRRFGDEPGNWAREAVVRTLVNKAVKLGKLDRTEEAVGVYDELLSRFGEEVENWAHEPLIRALVGKGIACGVLNRPEEEIDSYDEALRRFGDETDPWTRAQVAKALVNKGVRLSSLDRAVEELGAYDEVLRRFGEDTGIDAREQVAKACVYKGITFQAMGRKTEAIEMYDETLRRFGEDKAEPIRQICRQASLLLDEQRRQGGAERQASSP